MTRKIKNRKKTGKELDYRRVLSNQRLEIMITTAYKKIEQITVPLYQTASAYISEIPNCRKELISSFLFSFATGNLFSGGNIRMSFLSGTAALVATCIHTIAIPFFKDLFQ